MFTVVVWDHKGIIDHDMMSCMGDEKSWFRRL